MEYGMEHPVPPIPLSMQPLIASNRRHLTHFRLTQLLSYWRCELSSGMFLDNNANLPLEDQIYLLKSYSPLFICQLYST